MSAKHTPGPWEVFDLDHAIVVRTESTNRTKFGASRYAAIGGFERSDPKQHAEAIANARLIAAAPDLLESLKDCLRRIADDEEYGDDHAVTKARAAITKAIG